jgi:hypothetical protein
MAKSPTNLAGVLRSSLVDAGGFANAQLQKLFIDWDNRLTGIANQVGELSASVRISGRTEGIGTTVENIDSSGVVTSDGIDFQRPYLNKTTDHINDGTGSPLNGGKTAQAAMVDSSPSSGQSLKFNGSDWNPVHPAFSDLTGQIDPPTQMPDVVAADTYGSVTVSTKGLVTAGTHGFTGTIHLAKTTPITGSNGSLTIVDGIITAAVDPT